MNRLPANDSGPLYRDGGHYDGLNERYQADVEFYRRLGAELGDPVLEVACGTGRLTIPLAVSGRRMTGVDISTGMLAQARAKARKAGVAIDWRRGDCRRFSLPMRFRFIFIPFNSMAHLHDRPSIEAFFARVRAHLAFGGRFLVDVFNPALRILTRPPDRHFPVGGYPDPAGRGSVKITETNVYDMASQVNRIKWHFSFSVDGRTEVEELNMRIFYPQELDALLEYNGFRIVAKWGDFDRSPFNSASPKQLVLCAMETRSRREK